MMQNIYHRNCKTPFHNLLRRNRSALPVSMRAAIAPPCCGSLCTPRVRGRMPLYSYSATIISMYLNPFSISTNARRAIAPALGECNASRRPRIILFYACDIISSLRMYVSVKMPGMKEIGKGNLFSVGYSSNGLYSSNKDSQNSSNIPQSALYSLTRISS